MNHAHAEVLYRIRPPRTKPLVVSVARGRRRKSWSIDPALIAIGGVSGAVVGLGGLGRLLEVLLMWAL